MFLYIGSCRMSHSCDSPLTEDFYKNGKLQLLCFRNKVAQIVLFFFNDKEE
jgi:hypothetical protein